MTSDGYILDMHRISGGPKSPPRRGKQPIFLMHGLLDSSATWVLMRPNSGLGNLFLLKLNVPMLYNKYIHFRLHLG